MKIALPVILQFLAFGVMLAEWILPSFGLLSALALGLFGLSWYYILENFTGVIPAAFGIVDLLLLPICIYFGIKFFKFSPLTNDQKLAKGAGTESRESLIGKSGMTETALRPFGKVVIDGKYIDATSGGDSIDKGTPVKVSKINGLNIIVNPIEPLNSQET